MPVRAWTKRGFVVLRMTSAATIRQTPTTPPMATRPVGPIQALSTAYLKKKSAPRRKAAAPTRVSQVRPRCSSREGGGDAVVSGVRAGVRGGAGALAGAGAASGAG